MAVFCVSKEGMFLHLMIYLYFGCQEVLQNDHYILAEQDDLIWHNIQKGDEQALKCLFEAHYESLAKFAKSYLFDTEQSRDLVQTVFVKVWENANNISIHSGIKNYLIRAVRNQ